MAFKIISNVKYRLEFKLLIYMIVLSFISSLSGCTTTETLRFENEHVYYKKDYEIIKIILKDATVIDLRGIPIQYYKEYKDDKEVIVYTITDTTWITERSYTTSTDTNIIKIDEIKAITMEKTEIDAIKTILITFGIIAVIALYILIAFAVERPELIFK